ncbi:MBL fold metallo-hydrolase [Nocardioides marmorisolisilvae]|uniref:MBL fold metallo-hydrolase n=1 Tax=Nocardioides marmorisolisilvae TaxID=1542737 RepID=A0A3N0DUZ4_9ACTN|nr:MBL fold metallo-hydrolase [Nocardioides marmorisolisilvae]RNL79455.1 MBL fold metallo-hydrolase [Nocardioides marmorisolisilvae]
MTYTGEVTPGGTPDTRELQHLIITKVAVDPQMSNNAYVLRCRATDEQVLIDAAAEPETIARILGDGRTTKVITTHQHWDHHRALADVVSSTGAVTVAGEPDADAITEQTEVTVDDRVEHGDLIEFGDVRLEVIRITGHTPGSICLLYDDPDGTPHLFTGDSLFPGGVGNTFGDGDAFVSLINDVEERIFKRLPDETWFYPGHGNDSQLGVERPQLAEWRERGW